MRRVLKHKRTRRREGVMMHRLRSIRMRGISTRRRWRRRSMVRVRHRRTPLRRRRRRSRGRRVRRMVLKLVREPWTLGGNGRPQGRLVVIGIGGGGGRGGWRRRGWRSPGEMVSLMIRIHHCGELAGCSWEG
uniref:Uncharacterized protein n=1 Tax=Cucumis melo TaxID=3656 RepID=A0A9I9D2B3_CUCME